MFVVDTLKRHRRNWLVKLSGRVHDALYRFSTLPLYPINLLLVFLRRKTMRPGSVLHISNMVHIPYYTVKALRRVGVEAEYLAIGRSETWSQCDYNLVPSIWPPVRVAQEFFLFWKVVAKYEVVHSHFMISTAKFGWDLPVLRKLGRKVVVNFRGCDIRDRTLNMQLHPDVNICQDCDYAPDYPCQSSLLRHKRSLVRRYGDKFLVTTPDMRDFVPEAEHFPFFTPEIDKDTYRGSHDEKGRRQSWKIVHATTHPGIEGTAEIEKAIDGVRSFGHRIEFVVLKNVSHEQILRELATADLSIGKMKMGYYANAQIESMFLGVPAVTCIRAEFMTEELKQSGFILTTLEELSECLRYYLEHPHALAEKRRLAQSSIGALHDNESLAQELKRIYRNVVVDSSTPQRASL